MALRVYIDSHDGVKHMDCERVSHAISDYIDRAEEEGNELFQGKYFIEVSSPGVERPLYTEEHYARFAGNEVQVLTVQNVKISGRVVSCLDGVVTLRMQDGSDAAINFSDIKKGNLVYEEHKGVKKKKK
jgi:ribosome maturation factor RimP